MDTFFWYVDLLLLPVPVIMFVHAKWFNQRGPELLDDGWNWFMSNGFAAICLIDLYNRFTGEILSLRSGMNIAWDVASALTFVLWYIPTFWMPETEET